MNLDRALSIRQPWAELILAGHKPVENRTWWTGDTGPFIVHAGQKVDQLGRKVARALGVDLAAPLPSGYLGTARLVGVHKDEGCCRPWGMPGQYHWVLTEPTRFAEPIPGPGALGLYRMSADVLAALAERRSTT